MICISLHVCQGLQPPEYFVWTSLRLNAEPRMTLKSLNLTISTATTTAAAVDLGISLKALKIYKSVLTSKHQSILVHVKR